MNADIETKIVRRSAHRTQWAAQFAVASELCKRNYEVALTMGNHPTADIMTYSPGGVSFVIDVKGLYKKNYWFVREKPERADAYYISALVPENQQNRFFILSQSEVNIGIRQEIERARSSAMQKGKSAAQVENWAGVTFKYAESFESEWRKLPQ